MADHRNPTRLLLFVLCCALIFSACVFRGRQDKDTPPAVSVTTAAGESIQPLQFVTGRNDYVIIVDDTEREFIVHVPGGYRDDTPAPVVFLFHGSNHHPENIYNSTTWAEKAEQETIIAVYPGSWKYRLIGEPGLQEKWNSRDMALLVEPGTELQDDVKFVRTVLEIVRATFTVDESRIYASGFSSGADFVLTRLVPEMNDVFAAFSTAGAGPKPERGAEAPAPLSLDTSIYSVFGTEDAKIAELQGLPLPFPFTADEIVSDPHFAATLETATTQLNLSMSYTVESGSKYTRLVFNQSLIGADNEYIFMMILDMGHVYPSGDNNRAGIDAADLFWEFFTRHPRP